MKRYSIFLVIAALILASLACQTLAGGGNPATMPEFPPATDDNGEGIEIPTIPPIATDESGNITIGGESEFPLPDGAMNVMNVNGTVNFQVKMPLDEVMKYYQDTFTKSGYTERSLLTVTSDITFSMVYDGHESGKAIVVQGVDMGDGSVNINISLQDI